LAAIGLTAARAGALGMKALGASAGGCVFVMARDGREEELAAAIAPLGERLQFGIDRAGFQLLATMDEHTRPDDA
jgi:galactokinase/mevalonate kinase-like predicted kinase